MFSQINSLLKHSLLLLAVLLISLINSGCTIISESECRSADFSQIGFDDGDIGKSRDNFSKYHDKCLSYDIDIREELVMYDWGRERGLLNYCAGVKWNRICDRSGGAAIIKSQQQIAPAMLKLGSGLPRVGSSLSR